MSAPAETTQAVSSDASAASKEIGGHRVYMGNLPYTATEDDVRELASRAGGEILGIVMPLKGGRGGRRPGGFAFVHFKDEAQAQAAVEKLADVELGDRKLILQIGRSKEEQAARREQHLQARESAKAERSQNAKSEGTPEEDGGEKKRAPPKRNPRRRRPTDGEEGEEGELTAEAGAETDAAGATSDAKDSKPKRRTRKPREARIDSAEGADVAQRKSREPRQKLRLTDEKTSDSVFVSNLPFSLDEDGLVNIFANLSIRVKSAKIIHGFRMGRGGRPFRASRGFGTVVLEDPAQQQEAVEKVAGSLIGDRIISAKIANEMKPIEAEEASAAAAPAEPAA